MYKNKKIAAIIVAAGTGARMKSSIPKQFMKIGGKPVLVMAAEAFSANKYVDDVVVVTNPEHLKYCEELLIAHGINAVLTAGGEKRQDSVYEGLKKLPSDTDYVLIHDGARPFVTDEVIGRAVIAAAGKKAVVCAVPVKNTIRHMQEDGVSVTPDRSEYYSVQTPQAFEKGLILDAYKKAYDEGFYGTDDGVLAERAGTLVHIIEGSYDNIKITTRSDMQSYGETRIGTGFDVHAFVSGRSLILGGVDIPFGKGLAGHSDADVLLHAVMDAILGAAGLGDIGRHFPDSDEKYKGISSLLLLKEVAELIREKGYETGNIDVTLIAENPKIAPYTNEMKKNIAGATGIPENRINIKGTTTEGLGFAGRGEGIAAQAVCVITGGQ